MTTRETIVEKEGLVRVENESTLPKDCIAIRVEPDVSDEDFKIGAEFCVGVEILDGKGNVTRRYSAIVGTGPMGNGDPPYMEVRNPEIFRGATVRTFSERCDKDSKMVHGLRESIAEVGDVMIAAKDVAT